jgi:predicted nucleotidyltransferase
MIDLETKFADEVRHILRANVPECEVRVYGSRVRGTARRHSDLDLAIIGKTALEEWKIDVLKEAFAESDLPIMVDVLDWHTISESFRQVIAEQSEVLLKPVGGE